MKKIILITLLFSVSCIFSQENLPFTEFNFGDGTEEYKADIKEVYSYNNGQEANYEYLEKVDLLETTPTSVELNFFSNRLHTVNFTYSASEFEKLLKNLKNKYGKSWAFAADPNSWNWDLKEMKIRASKVDEVYSVAIFDESQKEFHFSDLFKGMVLWVIITIVGFFTLYAFISWKFSSYCKKCKSFKVKFQELSVENPVDYSYMEGHKIIFHQLPDVHYDKVYKFKCSKCGNISEERYSSWWSRYNKQK